MIFFRIFFRLLPIGEIFFYIFSFWKIKPSTYSLQVLLYVMFIVIMVRIYSLPLFAVRPMYLTIRAFKKAFNDVIMSRRAIHNMNTWYPDATEEELAAADNVCIICREEMQAPTTKKLPCNHIFHKTCLRSWFQRQQTCPTCRLDVLQSPAAQRQRQQAQPAPGAAPQPQQPQPQPPQQPPVPPFDPNLLAQMINNARLGMPQPPPRPTTGSSGATAAATATLPPLPPLPPFGFPPPPYAVPPPMPPPNFSGMTDEELSAMEGTERANVEARVKCLRNIQVLLDAAVLEMQQYSSVISRIPVQRPTTTAKPEPEVGKVEPEVQKEPEEKKETPEVKKEGEDEKPTKETGAIPKTSQPTTKVDDRDEIVSKMDAEDTKPDSPEGIRRRRLEKLQQNQN